MFVHRVLKALQKNKVKFAIAGGWAVALHGAVRSTVDLDIAVALTQTNMENVEKALRAIGLESRPPLHASDVIQFRTEYIKNRQMMAWRFASPSNGAEVVDVLIIEDLRDLSVESIQLRGKQTPVVALEDLIQMKKRSGRPQDLEDIKALKELKK